MDLIFVPRYMAELTKEEEESNKVKEDWKFVAMVLDRSFVIVINITIIIFVIVINSTIIVFDIVINITIIKPAHEARGPEGPAR